MQASCAVHLLHYYSPYVRCQFGTYLYKKHGKYTSVKLLSAAVVHLNLHDLLHPFSAPWTCCCCVHTGSFFMVFNRLLIPLFFAKVVKYLNSSDIPPILTNSYMKSGLYTVSLCPNTNFISTHVIPGPGQQRE